jgi:hypothetical protein
MTGLRTGLVTGLATVAAMGLLASTALAAVTEPRGEFLYPSPSQLPAPSAYNTTPACPTTSQNFYQCGVSTSALPPQDANNPERYINSAYWPAEKRPDIEMYAVMQYGYEYKDCSALLPHYCFLLDAEAVGYPVSHTPQAGDLWLAPCDDLVWMGEGDASGCGGSEGWYLGYVEEVLPDGSFIQSWGGSDTPEDTGLALSWMAASMDINTDFIGLMPPGQFPHLAGSACRYDICPQVTESPTLSSPTPHQGASISLTDGTWSGMSPITYAYQWQLCDPDGNDCSDIPEATSSSYTPTASDVGRTLSVVVTATNEVDSVAANSVESARVLAPGPRIESFKLSSYLKRKGGRTKAEKFLRASYTLSARSTVRLSIRRETSAHAKKAGVRSTLVMRVTLKGRAGANVYTTPYRLPRGTNCATITASAQGNSSSSEACF